MLLPLLLACGTTDRSFSDLEGLERITSETSSMYIKGHLDQKIKWYKWNEHNLKIILKIKKPIFLHIGYFGCHWCNRMSKDNFYQEDVVKTLNTKYISIIVDKEDLPEINDKYLAFQEVFIGQKGWPANLWLLPNLLPFYASSYVPNKATINENLSFLQLLNLFEDKFQNENQKAHKIAADALKKINNKSLKKESMPVDKTEKNKSSRFIGDYPILEMQENLYIKQVKSLSKKISSIINKILEAGIYDKVNGGVHRYSVTSNWETPHFEKKLDDNALLLNILANQYLLTKDLKYIYFGDQIINFIRNHLNISPNLYASILSADIKINNQLLEGRYYLYSNQDLPSKCFTKYQKSKFFITSMRDSSNETLNFCKNYYRKATPSINIKPQSDTRALLKDMIKVNMSLFEYGLKTNNKAIISLSYKVNENINRKFKNKNSIYQSCTKDDCYGNINSQQFIQLLELNFKLLTFKPSLDRLLVLKELINMSPVLQKEDAMILGHIKAKLNLLFDFEYTSAMIQEDTYYVIITGDKQMDITRRVHATLFPFEAIISKDSFTSNFNIIKEKKNSTKNLFIYICSEKMCFLPNTTFKKFEKQARELFSFKER